MVFLFEKIINHKNDATDTGQNKFRSLINNIFIKSIKNYITIEESAFHCCLALLLIMSKDKEFLFFDYSILLEILKLNGELQTGNANDYLRMLTLHQSFLLN